MLKLSRKTLLALEAVIDIAFNARPEPVQAKEITARQGVPRHAALSIEREKFVDLFDSPNQREGVNAFLEKRKPNWTTN